MARAKVSKRQRTTNQRATVLPRNDIVKNRPKTRTKTQKGESRRKRKLQKGGKEKTPKPKQKQGFHAFPHACSFETTVKRDRRGELKTNKRNGDSTTTTAQHGHSPGAATASKKCGQPCRPTSCFFPKRACFRKRTPPPPFLRTFFFFF